MYHSIRATSEVEGTLHRHPKHTNPLEIDGIQQRPLRQELTELPSMEDLLDAVDKLKNGKVEGKSGILPEMLKAACGNNVFAEMFLQLLHKVWEEKSVPKDWVDAILVPVPKKPDIVGQLAGYLTTGCG